jgi:hypothetical protein
MTVDVKHPRQRSSTSRANSSTVYSRLYIVCAGPIWKHPPPDHRAGAQALFKETQRYR